MFTLTMLKTMSKISRCVENVSKILRHVEKHISRCVENMSKISRHVENGLKFSRCVENHVENVLKISSHFITVEYQKKHLYILIF